MSSVPEYFQPFIDAIDSLELKHNYGQALAVILNNIMDIKIQKLRDELTIEEQSPANQEYSNATKKHLQNTMNFLQELSNQKKLDYEENLN